MSIILFGAGKIGQRVRDVFKPECIRCFVDNGKSGEIINRISVISFDELRKHKDDAEIVVSTSIQNSISIARQMEQEGINKFIFWKELFPEFEENKEEALLFRNSCKQKNVNVELVKKIRESLRFEMNSCEGSQVEFYFVDYFEFDHYLPLYEELLKRGIRAAMITEPAIYNTKATFNYEDAVKLLDNNGIAHYNLANRHAAVAITTQFPHNLDRYDGKKCHVAYGVSMTKGKSFILDQKNCKGFDLIMTNGEFYRQRIHDNGFKGKVVNISYPRYKAFFDEHAVKETILNELGVHTDKPILLYLPTYDEWTSIQKYASSIDMLRKDFFVITKPHHCTWYREEKKDDLKKLYDISDVVVDALFPLSDLAVVGDLAICDARSGVMNEISFLNPDIKKVAIMTNPDPEQFYIDISQFVDVVKMPQELQEHVRKLEEYDPFIEIRKEYTKYFYGDSVEAGIDSAVEAIISLL